MAYHCLDEVVQDSDFLRSVTHSFLVRYPMQAIASYFALNQNVTREEIGYEALWRLCERVGEVCGSTPSVIDADDLQRAPLKIMKSYCTAVGVKFRQESLEWKPTMEPEWDVWKGWHREVAASSGINRGHKRYRHTPRNHPLLRELYESQLPFYKKLRRLRIRQA